MDCKSIDNGSSPFLAFQINKNYLKIYITIYIYYINNIQKELEVQKNNFFTKKRKKNKIRGAGKDTYLYPKKLLLKIR